jgi:cell division protein FtsQ
MAETGKRRQAVKRNSRTQQRRGPGPELMQRIRALGGAVILTGVVLGLGWGSLQLYGWLNKPIEEIVLVGKYENFTRDEVAKVAGDFLHAGILSVDMNGLAASLEQQPWVADASVSRIWPNRLQITIDEYQPVMRWADRGLLSDTGRVIYAPAHRDYPDLPLVFSEQTSPQQLMNQFRILASALDQVDLSISELRQKPSGDWSAKLRNGVPVELGGTDLRGKIQRIIRLWQVELVDVQDDVAGIDARYTHGLVIQWHSGVAPPTKNS